MAVAALSAPKHRKDAEGDNNSADSFALLLVQEWLVACKLAATAQCLVDECARSERDIPTKMLWKRMVENLGFGPRSPATGGKRSSGSTTLLEALIRRVTEQHEKEIAQTLRNQAMVPQQQVVVMSKKRELKFVHKRSLPRFNNNDSERTPELSTSSSSVGVRPKSAMVYKSTSDLSKASSGDSLNNSGAKASMSPGTVSLVKKKNTSSKRPISAASVFTTHRDSVMKKNSVAIIKTPPSRSPTCNFGQHVVIESVDEAMKPLAHHHNSTVGIRASLPRITEDTGPAIEEDDEGKESPLQDEDEAPSQLAPTLSLEEMSEERLTEQFGSLSRCAIKKLRRVLAKSHAYSQEFEKSQRTVDKIKARAKLRQLRRVLAEEQTPLLTSTMAPLTSEPCSLCLYVFPKKNLMTKVSYKSIVDLRASWAAASGATTSEEAAQQAAEGMTHARMTHLYDEAPVCAFCSQLVLNSSSYRPSSADRRAQHTRERHEGLEILKELEAKKRRDLEKCDPLDYHNFELNSDDGGDSDVEEVVELGTDGRPQVVRRRRRQTMRAPVQLGVVSKRLHYDHLRSDSLHMLTLNEWQNITR
ncbi:hypothetical protein PInf_028707 [Phytophthora infestans]|nr:hypothetical protein PInf_028707 [Phytophthora infestans]